jgi:4-hydroxythreonine-4-phosphate dehydrogenase
VNAKNNGHYESNGQGPPRIGICMGDPAGIGPEVVVKALADPAVRGLGRFIIYGFDEHLSYAAGRAEINGFWYRMPHEQVDRIERGVVVADFDELAAPGPGVRTHSAEGGIASMQFLEGAIAALHDDRLDAVVTAPISKTSWKLAGYRFPGHTELFASAFDCRGRVTMCFIGGGLRVALVSTHQSLFDLRNSFTIGRVFQPIDLMHDALRDWFGIAEPRIAVAGLNPHASEDGRFGDEERRIIEPAIIMAREAGIRVDGPFPADTVFLDALKGRCDGVVAMYHDQGLIPVKLLAFDSAVNVTLGLPVIRTSVDHGTAFDIVGQNRANPGSMKSAIELAAHLARQRVQAPVAAVAVQD